MMDDLLIASIKAVASRYPDIIQHLSGKARWIALARVPGEVEDKTAGTYFSQLWNAIGQLYRNQINPSAFFDLLSTIITRQVYSAFQTALKDNGLDAKLAFDGGIYTAAAEKMIFEEYRFVDGFTDEVMNASFTQTGTEQFRGRAEMWANRYNEAYNVCTQLIASEEGEKLEWIYGDTEHCDTCLALNGIVASPQDWEASGVRPQNPPNDNLDCGGWRCQCRLEITDKRRTPDALNRIMGIAE